MSTALYDSVIADFYDASPLVASRLQEHCQMTQARQRVRVFLAQRASSPFQCTAVK